jgi:hypothetical protein
MQNPASPCIERASNCAHSLDVYLFSDRNLKSQLAIILILAFLIAVIPATAAEINISRDSISIEGKLERGDYQKMITAIKKHGSIPSHISLSSPGGDVLEAIKIGRFARKALLEFWASGKCNSACVFIYFGTVRGFVDPWGVFGIHRPYFDSLYFSGLSSSEAEQKYKEMENQVREYLREMDVPQFFIDRMFSVPSNSVQLVTHPEMVDIVGRRPPAYEEWIIAKCGSLSNEELQDLRILAATRQGYSKGYINYLENKRDAVNECEKQTQIEVRKKIYRSL